MKKRKAKKDDVPQVSASIRNRILILRMALEEPRESSTGKTTLVASTHGFRRVGVRVYGQDLYVTGNACIYGAPRGKCKK